MKRLAFGRSATGQLAANFDWAATSLGPAAAWPDALKTTLTTILHASLPMVLLWGEEGVLLYNDGYAEICGARHPRIFGMKVHEAWPEVAAHNQRVMDLCLAGDTVSFREEHLVIARNGYDENIWLDVDYSPVIGDAGSPAGVLCIVSEVTNRVLDQWRRQEAENQLALAIASADLGTWDYDLQSNIQFWSERTKAMFGMAPDQPVTRDGLLAALHPDDRDRAALALARAVDPAIRAAYDIEFRTIGVQDGVVRWVASKGRAVFDDDGTPLRVIGTALEITGSKQAELRQRCLVELGDRLRGLDDTASIAGTAAAILGQALGGSRAGYGVLVKDETVIVEADWTNGEAVSLAGPRLFAALGEAFCAPLRAGQIFVINDVSTHPATAENRQAFMRIEIGALINVPLMENGTLTAILYVHSRTPRIWTDAEIQLVRDTADRTWEASGRARAYQALRRLNESLEQEIALRTTQRDRIWRLSSDLMMVATLDAIITSANPAWNTVFGWTETDLIGRHILDLTHPEDRAAMRAQLQRLGEGHPMTSFESRYRSRSGNFLWLSWRAVPDDTAIHAVGRDITAEREQADALKAAEEALRQAQKMEAVGQLTGGIAHDFNNLLQGIVGSLDLMEKRLAAGRTGELEKFVGAARASANRAVALTHRLLAFSRRQPLDPKPVQANPLVLAMEELLVRTMGERIEIALNLAPDLWPTLCDPHQLESAILNLAINARDAMPDGGTLTLETCNTELDKDDAARMPEMVPGPYICVSVTDTGTGMSASVMEQAFEPFYTTKPLGQGTGLGLSMIYGFTKQSEGHARIYSELGQGTTVKLFLPRYVGEVPEAAEAHAGASDAPGASHATVLVVEDEEIVRGLVVDVLEEMGITTLTAHDGPSGLAVLQSRQLIDLLVTDIGLPGLNGRQMADAGRLLRPDLKILFMTGYAETAAMANGFLEPGMEMITKPFPIESLAARIRGMILA
jgi:PAS domain S-box-containing protein